LGLLLGCGLAKALVLESSRMQCRTDERSAVQWKGADAAQKAQPCINSFDIVWWEPHLSTLDELIQEHVQMGTHTDSSLETQNRRETRRKLVNVALRVPTAGSTVSCVIHT
jgi:hypothetical protein